VRSIDTGNGEAEGGEGVGGPDGEQNADDATGEGQDDAFEKKLAEKLSAGGSEGEAYGHLALTLRALARRRLATLAQAMQRTRRATPESAMRKSRRDCLSRAGGAPARSMWKPVFLSVSG